MDLLSFEEMNTVFLRWQNANPSPVSELDYTNPFTLLVAVVLSAQATDKSVNLATKELFQIADTPEKMLALGEDLSLTFNQLVFTEIKQNTLWDFPKN